jgi:hypothetical protein
MNAGADDRAAFRGRRKRGRNQRTDRGEVECRIERLRRQPVGTAGPHGAEPAGEVLSGTITRLGKGVNLLTAIARDLDGDMGCGTEAVEPEALGFHPQAGARDSR